MSSFSEVLKFMRNAPEQFPRLLNESIPSVVGESSRYAKMIVLKVKAEIGAEHLETFTNHLSMAWSPFAAFVEEHYKFKPILVFVATFKSTYIPLCIFIPSNFGALGIVKGSLAAAFQSWSYGAFTPAAGLFAKLTALGMTGLGYTVAPVVALGSASTAAFIAWAFSS